MKEAPAPTRISRKAAPPAHRSLQRLPLGGLICAMLGVAPGPALAGKEDAVERLVIDGKFDAAQARCERWEAWDPGEEPAVRDVCARAFWPAAQARGDRAAWAAFRQQWSGTETAARARSEEAAAALRELPPDASEALLVDLFAVYRGTESGERFSEKAAEAAIRDAASPASARAAATRWAGHPDLPALVERFPEAFLTLEVIGRRVDYRLDPPVELTGKYLPTVRWVAQSGSGESRGWDEEVARLMAEWGLPEAAVATLPVGSSEPALPVCWVSGQPTGWQAGVELAVGKGRLFQAVPWDDGCGPDNWPVFLSLKGGRVVGISLRPGHQLDLGQTRTAAGLRQTRAYLVAPPSTPLLWNGRVYERIGSAWLVTALSGGTPWASLRGPDSSAVPLSSSLKSGPMPPGWAVSGGSAPPRVSGPPLAKLPPALQDWTLVSGEVRVPPPLVREVLGLTPDRARPPRSVAPALSTDGWVRAGGPVSRNPPAGATVAGIYALSDTDLAQSLAAVEAVGLPRSSIELLDGWRADLDGDGVSERMLRAVVDGSGTVIVVDPLTEAMEKPDQARIFIIETPRVRADARLADTPFTFRKGDFVYLAWGGQEVRGATQRSHFVEVLRSDGAGFVVDDLDLP